MTKAPAESGEQVGSTGAPDATHLLPTETPESCGTEGATHLLSTSGPTRAGAREEGIADSSEVNLSSARVGHPETPESCGSATSAGVDQEGSLRAGAREEPQSGNDTFTREYVEKLRSENAKYRQRARQADELAGQLHTALVAATGRLEDPTDLGFDEQHLNDGESLHAAIDELLDNKPHLATRTPQGSIGQGATATELPTSLADIMRQAAN